MQRNDAHLIPKTRGDWHMIRRHGIKAWLTWASLDQACEIEPMHWWQRVARTLIGA